MPSDSHTAAARGALAAGMSFFFWGLWPLFWRELESVSPIELIAHRILWSALLLLPLMIFGQRTGHQLRAAITSAPVFGRSLLSGLLLATNWTIYIWAVNNGHVIDSSLGYFLTPLCNVALGYFVLHERLRGMQWTAVGAALAGVAVLLFRAGHLPWIALSLAGTWSLYGVLKKKSSLGPVPGLTMETLLLSPLAAALLLWRVWAGESVFAQGSLRLDAFALVSGLVTTLPLLSFAYGARRVRLATLGLLQYISPSVQFLLGLWFYHEPFDSVRWHACLLIWCGLALYTVDSFWAQRTRLRPVTDAA
jgi:chloramphenicol-sensitive protein RarD